MRVIVTDKNGKDTAKAIKLITSLVKQGIKPYYVYNEANKFQKLTKESGLKDNDFLFGYAKNPDKIEAVL